MVSAAFEQVRFDRRADGAAHHQRGQGRVLPSTRSRIQSVLTFSAPSTLAWANITATEELEDLCFDFGIEYDGDVSSSWLVRAGSSLTAVVEQGYRECQGERSANPSYAAQDRDSCQQVSSLYLDKAVEAEF